MAKFDRPPAQDQKVAVHFNNMVIRLTTPENKANAKYLLDKLKAMEYNSKAKNKGNIDKHQSNVELYNQWREFVRGDTGVGFGYEYKSQIQDG